MCTNHNPDEFLSLSKYPPAVGRISPQNYTIVHYRVEICKINGLQCDIVADKEHQLNCMICCT
jgi:hypothetical protein